MPYLFSLASLCVLSPHLSFFRLFVHLKLLFSHYSQHSSDLRLGHWVVTGYLPQSCRYRLNLLELNDVIAGQGSLLISANLHKVGKNLHHRAFLTTTFSRYSKEHCYRQVRAIV